MPIDQHSTSIALYKTLSEPHSGMGKGEKTRVS